MSEILLIRLGSTADQPVSWLHWDSSAAQTIDQGELANVQQLHQLAPLAIRTPCYALVPNEAVLTTSAQLPNNSRAAREAIPFQLEEQLCEDIEQLHFATGNAIEPGLFPVAVVDKKLMKSWQQWLVDAGLPVKALMADAQVLATTEQPQAIVLQQRLLVQVNTGQSFSLPIDQDNHWVQLAETQLGQPIADLSQLPSGLAALAGAFEPETAINLLQGNYKLKDPIKQLLRAWRLPALLLAVIAIVQLITIGWQNHQLQSQKQQLDQQINELFSQTLPNSRKVNPKSQFQQQLKQLSQRTQGSAFLQLLQQTLPAFSQVDKLSIQRLDFEAEQNRINLELESPSHDSLERFVTILNQQGLQARLERSRQQGAQIYGKLTIGGSR